MKYTIILCFILIFAACKTSTNNINTTIQSTVVTKARTATTSECSNGGVVLETYVDEVLTSSNSVCNGAPGVGTQGEKGAVGERGMAGHSVVTATVSSLTCPNGGSTIFLATDLNDDGIINFNSNDGGLVSADICNGSNGRDGRDGTDGRDGDQGQKGDTGATGAPGQNATPAPFSPVAIYDPCGNTSGIYDEVFLKLANGKYIAVFSDKANGENTRLSLLEDGNYVTTEGSRCYFSVKDNGTTIFNEHF